ncbi:MAG TPA: enoyl-CoA hydratase/isomerase family protein [Acidimicrobiia bacterium]|nr:enoyl-CoA hydratase/isomerase family protein [Acidimicrobiia bacterium]
MAEFETLLWEEPEPGTVLITLNRPPMNAVTIGMLDEIRHAMAEVAANPAHRVVIFTGAGERAFSAGADLAQFEDEFARASELPPMYFRYATKADLLALETLPKPVISAINGTAVGEGLEIAMASDFRIAGRSARLGFPEANIGLIPASGGCSRIVKLVGLARAKEMVMLGELMTAEEAERNGLLWKVVDDDALLTEAVALAAKLAKKAPLALGMAKAVLRACVDTDMTAGHTVEMLAQNVLMDSADHQEGVRAFLERRPPTFTGR